MKLKIEVDMIEDPNREGFFICQDSVAGQSCKLFNLDLSGGCTFLTCRYDDREEEEGQENGMFVVDYNTEIITRKDCPLAGKFFKET